MLVFQSMLLTTVAIVQDKTSFGSMLFLLILGLLTTLVWLYMNLLTRTVEKAAWAKLKEKDTRIQPLVQSREKMGSISWLMAYPFPTLMALSWALLLCRKWV